MSLSVKLGISNTGYCIEYPNMSSEGYHAIMNDVKPMGLYRSFLVPVRTNKIKSFILDFFLPSSKFFCDMDGKIHKIFAVLGALTLSVLTLPIRLVTSIPRYFYNRTRSVPHSHKWLQEDLKNDPNCPLHFQSALKKADYVEITVLSNSTEEEITLNEPICRHFIELPCRHW